MVEHMVKGTAIIPSVEYLRKNHESRYEEILERIPEDYRNIIESGILASSWYPVELLTNLLKAAKMVLGREDRDIIYKLGYASGEYASRGVYKVFFMVSSPNRMIQMADKIWNKYYSFGKFRIIENEKTRAAVRIEDTDFSDPLLCERIRGWMTAVLVNTGAKNVVVEHTVCVSRGGKYEEYRARWE